MWSLAAPGTTSGAGVPPRDEPMDQSQLVNLVTDPQTGLFTQAYFQLRVDEEFKRSMRYGWSYTLVLMDVHGLDDVEAEGGAAAVSGAWLQIANGILLNSRDVDLPARVTETRLALLLPGTELDGAEIMVQRVMGDILDDAPEGLSLDVGMTEIPRADLGTCDDFIARAEKALQVAASQGDNQLVSWIAPV